MLKGRIKMVAEINQKEKKVFQCEACGFYYLNRNLAEKCEEHCNKFHSCNIEITKHAIEVQND